ncbi:MAG: prepilin-type N-terminal cleavage/methylation domain-containing protein, partial [Planctomycetota bacterium]
MTSSFRTVHNRCADAARAGFSLIELLVVIVIIAIVIGITVPAIGGARDLARASSTQATLAGLGNAISSFRADEQRLPGYFNTRQMGRADTGLSGMQNIMLDLAGG